MRTLLFKVVRILRFTSRVTRWERSAAYDQPTLRERYRSFKAAIDPTLRSFSNVRVINLSDALCDETYCYVAHNKRSMYVDTHHLNRYGAVHVAQHIKGELADVFAELSGIPAALARTSFFQSISH